MGSVLERIHLMSELGSIERAIESLSSSDPLGKIAFERRRDEIQRRIEEYERSSENLASVALLFGGGPVKGARSIDAKFATDSLGAFQDIVSKAFAETSEQGLSESGRRVPHRDLSSLEITSLARGSFGFVMEEPDSDQTSMVKTALRDALDRATNLLVASSDEDEEHFLAILDKENSRVVGSAREFFDVLNRNDASFRIVEGSIDKYFDTNSVKIASERLNRTEVEESEDVYRGVLIGVTPLEMHFEFLPDGAREALRGRFGPGISQEYLERIRSDGVTLGSRVVAKIQTIRAKSPTGRIRSRYLLLDWDPESEFKATE